VRPILLTYCWFNRWSELIAPQKITYKVLKTLVVDAVAVEPVSTLKFPANTEKNREFCKIAASGAPEIVNNTVVTGLPIRIPCSTEQGIIFAKQGSLVQEQGIPLAKTQFTVG
jgi:hypothetical protein